MEGGSYIDRTDWWDRLTEVTAPRIVVIEDADRNAGRAAFIGETHAAILQANRCIGVVTNGAVRDLAQIEQTGFQLFSGTISVSHAYAHVAQVNRPVTVAGLKIVPGELLHGDRNGVVKIPPHSAERILEIAAEMRRREERILQFCRSKDFSLERLRNLLREVA